MQSGDSVWSPDCPAVLVVYPQAFNCYSKFARKLDGLLQNLSGYRLLASDDPREFCKRYADERSVVFLPVPALDNGGIDCASHAIVFDDGEEYPQLPQQLYQSGIHVRRVQITITRVVNLKTAGPDGGAASPGQYEYIGRGSYWGNPHSMYEEGEDREEVIRKYAYDFEYDKFPNKEKQAVYALAGKRLGCYCKPAPCHGDVLADFLNQWDDGK